MEAFLVSLGLVALAEMGDKTQLLSLVLAARFRKPVPVILGILAATLFNHTAAGAVGAWIMHALGPVVMRWIIGGSFLAMAAWTLIPDTLDEDETPTTKYGVFATTFVSFFIAEMGDKTQVATVALAAQYPNLMAVVAGTTIGMMLANVPVVFLGERITRRIPLRIIHPVTAALFAVLGLLVLFNVGKLF
ncbi:MAG TPA: TMEM165/GDT1 family protein [Moraxellaceae bacterium]|nr:TMEM165/GDT1 family protein [Moraxellaceae bacterium]